MAISISKERKLYSYSEIAKHNRADDCWLVIRGKVYDVTEYVPKHPGGNMIFMSAGLDSTYLFESYHPEKVKSILDQYYIGDVSDTTFFYAKYADGEKDMKIYNDLKKRVEKYFKENNINPRFSWQMYVKTAIILMGVLLSFFATFFMQLPSFWLSCVCALLLGFFTAEIGVSIQHDANHASFSQFSFINKYMGITLDLVGGSSFIWKQQHSLGHHVYTNIEQLDPDIRVNDPDVRRVTHCQPWQKYQKYQHMYLGILYGILAIKSIFIDDVQILLKKHVGPCPINHIHFDEKIVFWFFKSFYLFYYILLPMLFGQHTIFNLVKLWLIAQFTTGWMLALMFQVNHVTEDAIFYEVQKDGCVTHSWLKTQIEGTTDFAHDSWFWTHISGGLNYQVVHHLFPWICHVHYPKIAPFVKDMCHENGFNYIVYPTFLSALIAHFKHMKNIGLGKKLN